MCGIPLGIKDLFCTEGVPSQAASADPRRLQAEYESTVTSAAVRRGRGDAGQAQHGRVRHGLVERDLVYGNAVNPWRRGNDDTPLTPGGSSGGSAAAWRRSLPCRDRHRHRRLDPPARGLHRHRRAEAHLWPLLALGHRGLRLVARPGRADDQDGARRRDHAAGDGRARPEGQTSADLPCRISRPR
jgi:hypothetical protein